MTLANFTNGEKVFTISTDLLNFAPPTNTATFLDMDSENIRKLLNCYRNGNVHSTSQILRDDKQFKMQREKIIVNVGNELFFTSKETLLKLPYFEALYRFQKNVSSYIDRDPILFRQLLTVLRHGAESVTDELIEELRFWALTNEQPKELQECEFRRFRLSIVDVALVAVPELDLFHPADQFNNSHSVFLQEIFNDGHFPMHHRYLRTLPFEKRNLQWKKKSDCWNVNLCDMIGPTFMVYDSEKPVAELTELFDSVTFVCSGYSVTHSAAFITMLAKIHKIQPFSIQKYAWRYVICIPLLFPFCLQLCNSFPSDLLLGEKKTITVAGDNLPQHIHSDCFKLTKEDRDFQREAEYERLYTEHECLISDAASDEKGTVNFNIDSVSRCGVPVQSFHIVAKDKNTGKIRNCALHGQVFVDQFILAPISIHHNQMNQYNLQRDRPYDPSLWIITFSATNIASSQPGGHFTIPTGKKLQFQFQVLENASELEFEIWIAYYTCFRVHIGTAGLLFSALNDQDATHAFDANAAATINREANESFIVE